MKEVIAIQKEGALRTEEEAVSTVAGVDMGTMTRT